ncbi:hypothetical protein AB5I41_01345 [Sphingomonas sp. MMS24-JH45]
MRIARPRRILGGGGEGGDQRGGGEEQGLHARLRGARYRGAE